MRPTTQQRGGCCCGGGEPTEEVVEPKLTANAKGTTKTHDRGRFLDVWMRHKCGLTMMAGCLLYFETLPCSRRSALELPTTTPNSPVASTHACAALLHTLNSLGVNGIVT